MADGKPFVDYYDVLQVNPSCDAKILESAYHYLAKMYHPDRPATADAEKFGEVIAAYRALRNPEDRAEYDRTYFKNGRTEAPRFPSSGDGDVQEQSAIDDADDHATMLMFLYKRRRENAQNAGVAQYYVQDMLQCSDEHFEFHKWYLKEKGFIVVTEQGMLAITIQGVDHVISMSRTAKAEKLLIAQSDPSEDRASD
jgi:curved DNA-binding protein